MKGVGGRGEGIMHKFLFPVKSLKLASRVFSTSAISHISLHTNS